MAIYYPRFIWNRKIRLLIKLKSDRELEDEIAEINDEIAELEYEMAVSYWEEYDGRERRRKIS